MWDLIVSVPDLCLSFYFESRQEQTFVFFDFFPQFIINYVPFYSRSFRMTCVKHGNSQSELLKQPILISFLYSHTIMFIYKTHKKKEKKR